MSRNIFCAAAPFFRGDETAPPVLSRSKASGVGGVTQRQGEPAPPRDKPAAPQLRADSAEPLFRAVGCGQLLSVSE